MSGYATYKGDGFTIESNTRTAEQMAESFKAVEKAEKAPEAAPEPAGEARATPETTEPGEPEAPFVKSEKRPRDDPKARAAEATREKATSDRIAAAARRKVDEVERRAQAVERELAELKARTPKAEAPKTEGVDDEDDGLPPDFPRLNAYKSIEAHSKAVTEYILKAERKQTEDAEKAKAFEQITAKRLETFAGKIAKQREADPEWTSRQNPDVVSLKPFSLMTPEERKEATPLSMLADRILKSENPVALIEKLTEQPEVVERIRNAQSEEEFLFECFKVESGIGSAATTAPATIPPISKAAPPARPVTGGPPTGPPNVNKMSLEESFKYFAEMDRKTGRSR